MKKFFKKRPIILIILLIVIIFSLWYHYPIKKVMNMDVCTLDGQTGNMYIDIKFYRFFFKPSIVRGKIIFNETEYIGIIEKDSNYYKNNFFANIKLKFSGFCHFYFVNSSLLAPDYIHDTIQILNISGKYNLHAFSFLHTKKGIEDGLVYYAPAVTEKEAYDIYKLLYPNVNNDN